MDKETVSYLLNGILLSHQNKVVSLAATWMDVKNVMLSETSQTYKDKGHMHSFICANH
jgi:hypothetical protein